MRSISPALVVAIGMFAAAAAYAAEPAPSVIAEFCDRNVGISYDTPIEQLRALAPLYGEVVIEGASVYDESVIIKKHQLHFVGLYVSVATWNDRVILDEIRLDGAPFELPLGVRLGISSPSETESIFGTAQMYPPEDGKRVYACNESETTVTFTFDGQRLSSVHWAYYWE